MDAVEQSADVEGSLDSLERLYLASAAPPASADVLASQGDAPAPAGEEQQRKRKHDKRRDQEPEEVCGKLACAQHVERQPGAAAADGDGAANKGAAAQAEAAPANSAGFLDRLLALVPLSPRTRGILMLNLLVLLVATNWVSLAPMSQQACCVSCWACPRASMHFFAAAACNLLACLLPGTSAPTPTRTHIYMPLVNPHPHTPPASHLAPAPGCGKGCGLRLRPPRLCLPALLRGRRRLLPLHQGEGALASGAVPSKGSLL